MSFEFKLRHGNIYSTIVDGVETEILTLHPLWDKYNNVDSLLNKASRHLILPQYAKINELNYDKFINMMRAVIDFYGLF